MIDLDALDRIAQAAFSPALSGMAAFDAAIEFDSTFQPVRLLEILAELRTLRARLEIDPRHSVDGIDARDETIRGLEGKLTTPIAMEIRWSPIESSMMSGFNYEVLEDALARDYAKAKSVTVYYGEKGTYKTVAAFCAAHPQEGV